jgi:hypothetical protein
MKHPTVYSRKNPSPTVRNIDKIITMKSGLKILDFGAGLGRNSLYLSENYDGLDITTYDPNVPEKEEQLFPINNDWDKIQTKEYDLLLMNYVLNVVPKKEQIQILRQIDKLKWKNLIIELRPYKELEKNAKKNDWKVSETNSFGTGWITSSNTFQMGYDDPIRTLYNFALHFDSMSLKLVSKSPSLVFLYTR